MIGKKKDAHIEILFTEGFLEAHASFYPADEDGSPLSREYADELIKSSGIVYGIQEQSIDNAVRLCNEEKQPVSDVLIAIGDFPINEKEPYIRLNPALSGESAEDAQPFIIVRKDQVLGRLEPFRHGKNGKNVLGESVPYREACPSRIRGEQNTRMEGRFLVSEIDGQLINDNGAISVQPNLEIKRPMLNKAANIVFPGDIKIYGPVSDGFKIYSGGSVSINNSVCVSDAVTKGNLYVGGGIAGKAATQVKVGGSLKTEFIENCHVACRKTVNVSEKIVNSTVYCLEKIECPKSRIIGGEIWAFDGIRAATLERISGCCPKIHCGIDFAIEQVKEKNNNTIRVISAKLGRLRLMAADPSISDEKKAKLEELRLRLVEDQNKACAVIAGLLGTINTNENAEVEITGEVAPGTLIEICKTSMYITKPLHRVRIRLDQKDKKKLITEAL